MHYQPAEHVQFRVGRRERGGKKEVGRLGEGWGPPEWVKMVRDATDDASI